MNNCAGAISSHAGCNPSFYQDFPSLPKRNPFTISCHPAKLTIPAEAFRAKYWVVVLFFFPHTKWSSNFRGKGLKQRKKKNHPGNLSLKTDNTIHVPGGQLKVNCDSSEQPSTWLCGKITFKGSSGLDVRENKHIPGCWASVCTHSHPAEMDTRIN